MFSSLLFIRWRKEREREEDEVKVIVVRLSLSGSLVGAPHFRCDEPVMTYQ